jgi:hypothetical protein
MHLHGLSDYLTTVLQLQTMFGVILVWFLSPSNTTMYYTENNDSNNYPSHTERDGSPQLESKMFDILTTQTV